MTLYLIEQFPPHIVKAFGTRQHEIVEWMDGCLTTSPHSNCHIEVPPFPTLLKHWNINHTWSTYTCFKIFLINPDNCKQWTKPATCVWHRSLSSNVRLSSRAPRVDQAFEYHGHWSLHRPCVFRISQTAVWLSQVGHKCILQRSCIGHTKCSSMAICMLLLITPMQGLFGSLVDLYTGNRSPHYIKYGLPTSSSHVH